MDKDAVIKFEETYHEELVESFLQQQKLEGAYWQFVQEQEREYVLLMDELKMEKER